MLRRNWQGKSNGQCSRRLHSENLAAGIIIGRRQILNMSRIYKFDQTFSIHIVLYTLAASEHRREKHVYDRNTFQFPDVHRMSTLNLCACQSRSFSIFCNFCFRDDETCFLAVQSYHTRSYLTYICVS